MHSNKKKKYSKWTTKDNITKAYYFELIVTYNGKF